jgi:hypothetical protein
MQLTHKKLGSFGVKELTQRMAEGFEEGMEALQPLTGTRWAGGVVRLAATVGWLEVENVDELAPAAVLWLSKQILDLYKKAFEIDPN